MPTCLKTKTPRKPYTDNAGTGCHINTSQPRGGCDFESKGQSQHKDKWLVVSNLRWDTARLQLAGRLETRVMGVFWEEA